MSPSGNPWDTSLQILKFGFRRSAGGRDIDVGDVTTERVLRFLGRPTSGCWHKKYSVLNVFYRYAISRGYVSSSPLPAIVPKRPRVFVPYIYSAEEVRRLLDATASYRKTHLLLEPYTFRAIILILYGAGLRISEALSLRIGDVDFSEDVLLIRDTKFFKSRLLPIGHHLKQALMAYAAARRAAGHSESSESPFFVGRKGSSVTIHTVQQSFRQLRRHAGIHRSGGARNQPASMIYATRLLETAWSLGTKLDLMCNGYFRNCRPT